MVDDDAGMNIVPRTIGRYRIDGVLGEGAMAVVYAGFDPGIDRPVAIKCLRRRAAAAQGSEDRLLAATRPRTRSTAVHSGRQINEP